MRFMVPLDGSTTAEYALGQAAFLARQSLEPVEIVLVRVISLSWLAASASRVDIGPLILETEEAAGDYLREVTLRPSLEKLRVTTQVTSTMFGVAETLSQQAKTLNADFVLMASHGRTGIGRVLLGSVASDLMRMAPVPVLIVRLSAATAIPTTNRRITFLVPLDESPFAEHSLAPTAALAHAVQGDIVVFSVLPASSGDAIGDRDLLERTERYLLQQVDRLKIQGITARMSLALGEPAPQIVKRVAKEDDPCDVIVMTTHALPQPERFFLGSVAEDVLRQTTCPMMIVHPQDAFVDGVSTARAETQETDTH